MFVLYLVLQFVLLQIKSGNCTSLIDFEKLRRMGSVVSHCKQKYHAALTFDDGIDVNETPRLLEILRELKVKATFFILGRSISKYRDISKLTRNKNYKKNRETLRLMVGDGHDVGIHTFDHTPLTSLSKNDVKWQIEYTSKLIKHSCGVKPKFFRAPEGKLSDSVLSQIEKLGYVTIHWNVDPEDWAYQWNDPQHMVNYINNYIPEARIGIGPIILQHDIIQRTIEDQFEITQILKKKGYRLVSMKKCINIRPYEDRKIGII